MDLSEFDENPPRRSDPICLSVRTQHGLYKFTGLSRFTVGARGAEGVRTYSLYALGALFGTSITLSDAPETRSADEEDGDGDEDEEGDTVFISAGNCDGKNGRIEVRADFLNVSTRVGTNLDWLKLNCSNVAFRSCLSLERLPYIASVCGTFEIGLVRLAVDNCPCITSLPASLTSCEGVTVSGCSSMTVLFPMAVEVSGGVHIRDCAKLELLCPARALVRGNIRIERCPALAGLSYNRFCLFGTLRISQCASLKFFAAAFDAHASVYVNGATSFGDGTTTCDQYTEIKGNFISRDDAGMQALPKMHVHGYLSVYNAARLAKMANGPGEVIEGLISLHGCPSLKTFDNYFCSLGGVDIQRCPALEWLPVGFCVAGGPTLIKSCPAFKGFNYMTKVAGRSLVVTNCKSFRHFGPEFRFTGKKGMCFHACPLLRPDALVACFDGLTAYEAEDTIVKIGGCPLVTDGYHCGTKGVNKWSRPFSVAALITMEAMRASHKGASLYPVLSHVVDCMPTRPNDWYTGVDHQQSRSRRSKRVRWETPRVY